MSEYYRPIGAYPLRYFYEIINVSSAFRDALAVKNFDIFAQGITDLWGVLSVWVAKIISAQ